MPMIGSNPVSTFIAKWRSLTPEQKQQWINNTGEMFGGTAGAISGGGWLSVPAAGAGAVLGKLAAEKVGPAMGGSGAPKRTGGQEAADLGATFGINAAGEAVGRSVPMAIRALKPTARAAQLTQMLDRMGIPTGLPERTGSQLLQQLKTALGHVPISGRIVQSAEKEAYTAWESYMGKVLNGIDPASVSREKLATLAEQGVQQARTAFNAQVHAELDAVAHATHPAAVTAQSTGVALKNGLAANKNTLSSWAGPTYDNWLERASGSVADATNIAPKWNDFIRSVQPEARGFLPRDIDALSAKVSGLTPQYSRETARALDQIAGRFHADGMSGGFATLTPRGQQEALAMAKSEGVDLKQYMDLDAPSLMQIRKNVTDFLARLPRDSKGTERYAGQKLLGSVDEALTRLPDGLGDEYSAINSDFAKGAQATRGPMVKGGSGNPMARAIDQTSTPEALAEDLTKPHRASKVAQADTATNPQSMSHIVDVSSTDRPLDQVGRLAVQDVGQRSLAASGRVSPGFINKHLLTPGVEDTYRPLLGNSNYAGLKQVARPDNLAEEASLYTSPLAKAVNQQPNADSVFGAMFPPKAATGVVDNNLGLLPRRSTGQRAFAQDLVFGKGSVSTPGQSRMAKATGDAVTPFVNSAAALRRAADYGSTMESVLGKKTAPAVQEGLTALQHIQEPQYLYGNGSGTTPMRQTLKLASSVASIPVALATGAAMGHPLGTAAFGLGVAPATATALTNPALAKWLTNAAQSKALPWVTAAGGALGRAAGLQGPVLARKQNTADEIPLDQPDEIPLDQ